MIAAAIEKILSLKNPSVVEVVGRQYSTERLSPILEPVADALSLNTLTGLVDYMEDCVDGINPLNFMVHVVDEKTVRLISDLQGDFEQRETRIETTALLNSGFAFGRYHDLEDFIISLQANFVRTETVEKILGFISSVDSDAKVNQTDDGFSQKTTVKQGVALRAEAAVPNPVTLAPFRTFLEVEQPSSQYVFRVKNEGGVKCALFEAGGGQWRLEAIQKVKTWLDKKLPKDFKVIA